MKYNSLLIIVVVIFALVLVGCSSTTTNDVLAGIGEEIKSNSVVAQPVISESNTFVPEEIMVTNTSILRKTEFKGNDAFCRNESNYNFEKITLTPASVYLGYPFVDTFKDNILNEWHPSISEGRIGSFWIVINNEGCTKISTKDFEITYQLYLNNKLLLENKRTQYQLEFSEGWTISPQDSENLGSGIFEDSKTFYPYKLSSSGNYKVVGIVYYKKNYLGALVEEFNLN